MAAGPKSCPVVSTLINNESVDSPARYISRLFKNVSGYEYIYLPKNSGEWIKGDVAEALEELDKPYEKGDVGNIVIEILNGTDIVGLASRARSYLTGFGFDVIDIGNTEEEGYEKTVVIAHNSEHKARKLADLINCDNVIVGEELENKKIDVTLILGSNFDGKVVR